MIDRFENTLTNIGRIETSGWDVNLFWDSPTYNWGRLSASWHNSLVDEFIVFNPTDTGLQGTDLAGIERSDRGFPEWQSNLRVDWGFADWHVSYTLRHISELTEDCSDALDGTAISLTNLGLCSNPDFENNDNSTNELDAITYHDIQVAWTPLEHWTFAAGVHNLLEEDPPPCLSCSLNGYDPSTYDPEGRFVYVRASLEY